MDFYKLLTDIGLVRVQLRDEVGTQPSGTIWWVGKLTAEGLVRSGKAALVPLPEAEAKDRSCTDS